MRNCSLTPACEANSRGHPEVPVEQTRPAQRVVAAGAEARLGDFGKRRLDRSTGVPRPTPPSFSTSGFTWSAVWLLPGRFSEVPSAKTLNGTPLMTLIRLLICQPPRDARRHALVAQPAPSRAERELPDVRDAEVVRPVGAGERVVAAHVRRAPGRSECKELFSLGLMRLPPRVIHAEAKAVGEPPLQAAPASSCSSRCRPAGGTRWTRSCRTAAARGLPSSPAPMTWPALMSRSPSCRTERVAT